jgi:hypothetical protein
VAPSPLRDRLEETFRFDASDLDANRSGRFSRRQDERMRAARGAGRGVLALFVAVLIGVIWLLTRGLTSEQTHLIAASVATAGVVGYFSSRSSLKALGSRRMAVAEGRAEADHQGRLRLGGKTLALATPAFLDAFEPGAAYRVFYVDGPRALVLSAEPLDERADGAPPPAPVDPRRDPIVLLARRALWIPFGIVVVSAQMVAVLLLEPRETLLPVFLAVLAEGVAFAGVAIWWLRRQR